jgi:hypothetical protein
MLETSTNGATDDGAAAGREDQGARGELEFVAGGRAAPAVVPDPELVEQAKRRSFTARYKLEILAYAFSPLGFRRRSGWGSDGR